MGLPPIVPPAASLGPAQRTRYARHLLLPGLGAQGQQRLSSLRVLVVGAGGLGSPAVLYLAAAGVGAVTVVDDDVVELTNLQRQVVHTEAALGTGKADSAARAGTALNAEVSFTAYPHRLTAENVLDLVADHDVVVDGADNFPTRYLVGDACARLDVPHVWGSVHRYDGQVSVWWPGAGAEAPCYACVFPEPPPAGSVPSCSTGGVLGSVCGTIGSLLVTEVVKLATGLGEPLVGRLLVHDALTSATDLIAVRRRPDCRVCGPGADPHDPLGTVEEGMAWGPVPSVTVRELAALLAVGPVDLVDVREPGEREVVTIPGDRAVHLDAVRAGTVVAEAGERVYLYCRSGARSAEAAALLRLRGVDAVNVTGGVLAWVREVDPTLPEY